MQAWVLPHLIDCVEQQGFDSAPIRQLFGSGDLADPDLRVPESAFDTAWRLAASITGDAAIGIHVAEFVPRGTFDLVEYAFRSSSSLAAGLERLARYGRVISDRIAPRVETQGDTLVLLLRDIGSITLTEGRAEFALALALRFSREATRAAIVPLQVSFAHPAPADDSEHRRFFRGPLRFAAGMLSMSLTSADGARMIPAADEALCAIIGRRLDKVLAARGEQGASTFSQRVRRLVVERLGDTELSPDTVARVLAVSRRTLSRRLADEGTSFRAILDDVRREFAYALLQDRSLSIADVAFFLQYAEPAVFNRSFRRWTGQTPGQFRAA